MPLKFSAAEVSNKIFNSAPALAPLIIANTDQRNSSMRNHCRDTVTAKHRTKTNNV